MIACSADGTRIMLTPELLSTDSGQTWTNTWTNSFFPGYWRCVASSANGSSLFAATLFTDTEGFSAETIVGSTNAGETWSVLFFATNLVNESFRQLACSEDGTTISAATTGGHIFISTDKGISFAAVSVPSNYFGSVASSADGTLLGTGPYYKIDANGFLRPIYRSTDDGNTWTEVSEAVDQWSSVIISADGSTILGLAADETIISHDSGRTWLTNTILPGTSVGACSADGMRIVAEERNGAATFISLDGGRTWTTNSAPSMTYYGLAMSADGSVIYAAGYQAFRLTIPAQPSLRLASAGGSLLLSWPLPSTGFVLQQSASLSAPNWRAVTNAVIATNYWNEVIVPPPANGPVFYRLVQP
jgi:photosystem II stability/assembly factor-like uncharacterized protein